MNKRKAAVPYPAPRGEPAGPGAAGIVTSAHLVSKDNPESSELEFALTMAANAFARWAVRCMAAAGRSDLTALDVLILHHVHHRERPKKTADICFVLNVEDTHTVTYSLKKLVGLGLLTGRKEGKEVFYATTASARQHIDRYAQLRQQLLVDAADNSPAARDEIRRAAQLLRTLSGLYDQAARAASAQ